MVALEWGCFTSVGVCELSLAATTAVTVLLTGACLPSAGTAPRVPTGARWRYG